MTTLKQRLDQDLKTAMLAGEKFKVTVLRGLKSVILYAEVAKGARAEGLSDPAVVELLGKEAKKRQESADLYNQGGQPDKATAELTEKTIIEQYLPQQLSDDQLAAAVEVAISELKAAGPQAMGQVIGAVKQKTAGQADGARIATLVKERLTP